MSYKEALQGNNIDLQSILDEINELPDRNDGSSDGPDHFAIGSFDYSYTSVDSENIDTTTVSIELGWTPKYVFCYTRAKNGYGWTGIIDEINGWSYSSCGEGLAAYCYSYETHTPSFTYSLILSDETGFRFNAYNMVWYNDSDARLPISGEKVYYVAIG